MNQSAPFDTQQKDPIVTLRRILPVLAAGALALAGCSAADTASTTSTTTSSGEPVPLTVGLTYVPDIQFAPFYLADSLGYYEEAGLSVELRHHGASESLFGAIGEGTEDVVIATGDEVLAHRAGGGDLTMVGAVFGSSPVALIAPEDDEIASVADLRGASIGLPGEYGSTYLGLLMLLWDAGMDVADIDLQSIGYTQTTALLTGQVDAVMGYENGDAVRIAAGGTPVTTLLAQDLVSVGVAATDETVADQGEALDAFMAATLKGAAAISADLERAVEISSDYIPGMTQQAMDDALAVLEATVPLLSATGEIDQATWDAMGQAMLSAGMIDAVPDGGLAG